MLAQEEEDAREDMELNAHWGEEDYTLTAEARGRALRELGLSQEEILVDLFASPQNATRPLYITKDMDSFGFDWGTSKKQIPISCGRTHLFQSWEKWWIKYPRSLVR